MNRSVLHSLYLFVILVGLYGAWTGTFAQRPPLVGSQVELTELETLDPLKSAFQADAGDVRIVTLLSPT